MAHSHPLTIRSVYLSRPSARCVYPVPAACTQCPLRVPSARCVYPVSAACTQCPLRVPSARCVYTVARSQLALAPPAAFVQSASPRRPATRGSAITCACTRERSRSPAPRAASYSPVTSGSRTTSGDRLRSMVSLAPPPELGGGQIWWGGTHLEGSVLHQGGPWSEIRSDSRAMLYFLRRCGFQNKAAWRR